MVLPSGPGGFVDGASQRVAPPSRMYALFTVAPGSGNDGAQSPKSASPVVNATRSPSGETK
jgi:hypothetical protein